MENCKYHPDTKAKHHCSNCNIECCDHCVDEGHHGENAFCFTCDQATVKSEGPADVTPFWRRIDQGFRYPLERSVLIFIVIISLFSAIASLLPLPLMVGLSLLTTGIMIKYCFNCLSETASGKLSAPEISGAFEGGILLIFRLFLMLVISTVVVGFIYASISTVLGSLLGIFLLVASPAVIITYAMTESITEALNPIKLASIITTIGLPYGLILAILMIMIGSVDILSNLIGYEQSLGVLTLQAVVSNFYSIVMFHLMGYMIYQYQYELGVDTSSMHDTLEVRPEQERLLAKARVLLKEGYWGSAEKTLDDAMKRFQTDDELNEMNFRFKLATYPLNQEAYQHNERERQLAQSTSPESAAATKRPFPSKLTPTQELAKVADHYLLHLTQQEKDHQLTTAYQLVAHQTPNYKPQQAKLRHQLAQGFYDAGNPRKAAQLINGLHKDNPKYGKLIPAYELLKRSLSDIPGMERQAQACQGLIAKLKQRHATLTNH
ncbi:MAG: hypothetical protein ACRBBW_14660 [Cellvibrionaceae bacterium]